MTFELDLPALGAVIYLFEWILRVLALFVVPRNRKPTSGMAWLLIIFLVPIPGFIVFAILGSPKLPKGRRDSQKTLDYHIETALKEMQAIPGAAPILDATPPKKYASIARLSESLTHLPVFAANAVTPITGYDAAFEAIIADIETAKHIVYVEYYILALDASTEPLFVAMEAAAARGVVVRVMYDSWGSRKYPRRREMKRRLTARGIQVVAMLPLRWPGRGYVRPDLRNHRKLVVIDGYVGYTGSQNLITRDYHRKDDIIYDELVVRLQGPVVVQLEAVFLTDWFSETKVLLEDQHGDMLASMLNLETNVLAQVLPSGPGYEDENNLKLFTALMYSAQRTITIVNPYFVPDEALITALVSAARRGVKVTMINSEAVDQFMVAHAQRSYYEQLFKAGVAIHLYRQPELLHSKYLLIDDDLVAVGSSNMDIRSFELNHELTLITYDSKVSSEFHAITEMYLGRSTELDGPTWLERRRFRQLLDNLARLSSSLQ